MPLHELRDGSFYLIITFIIFSLVDIDLALAAITSIPSENSILVSQPTGAAVVVQDAKPLFNDSAVPTIVLEHADNTTLFSSATSNWPPPRFWPPTPFKIDIPNHPNIHFFITSVAPSGSQREVRWLYATLEALIHQISTSTATYPSIFSGGKGDIAEVEIKEYPVVLPIADSRAAISAGLQILHDSLIYYQPAQLKAIFGAGMDSFAEMTGTFSPFPPLIPDLWRDWPISERVPGIGRSRLRFRDKPQTCVGDGWDLKHGVELLQGAASVLQRHQRMGESRPVDVSLKTPALDLAFKYETEVWSLEKPTSTLQLEVQALAFYLSLVQAHGVEDGGFALYDGATSRKLGFGGFTFRDFAGGLEGQVNSTAVSTVQDDTVDGFSTS